MSTHEAKFQDQRSQLLPSANHRANQPSQENKQREKLLPVPSNQVKQASNKKESLYRQIALQGLQDQNLEIRALKMSKG